MSASPWLSASDAQHTPGLVTPADVDPWAAIDGDRDLLQPGTAHHAQHRQQQLRSRKSSSFLTSASASSATTSTSHVVDRHPLRSPSPGQGLGASTRPEPSRRPSAVAAEWKAIGAGLAGLFGASSSSTSSAGYTWPADPASSSTSTSTSISRASRSTHTLDSADADDEARKGRPANTVESTLGRLEDWFGLRQPHHPPPPTRSHVQRHASSSSSSSAATATTTASTGGQEGDLVRVLMHPVAAGDTLASLALHYGADIQVLRKANRLWPGDPVQIRNTLYIPVDSCKHRPPNAEIKLLPSRAGAIASENAPSAAAAAAAAAATTLAFVPRPEEQDLLTGTPVAEIASMDFTAQAIGAARASDPVAQFMPETNMTYTDSPAPARAATASTASLTPGLRALNQAHAAKASRTTAGSKPPSVAASASGASSGFVPPRAPIHVAKVPADQLRFFANEAKPSSTAASTVRKPGPGDADYRPGASGIDDLLALSAAPNGTSNASTASTAVPRPGLSRNISISTTSASAAEDEEDEWRPNTWHFGSSTHKSDAKPTGAGGGYAGWNDAPAADAIVAQAYDGGGGHRRRQAQNSHRLLYDLAAGLPANPGKASKWARPITFGDSLPTTTTPTPSSGGLAKGKGGLGRLLDDTIRGRISVETALGTALDGVRPKPTSTHPPPRRTPQVGAVSTTVRREERVASVPTPSPTPLPAQPSSSSRLDWTKRKDD